MASRVLGSGGGLSIRAVSELLGIPAPTIRSWERRYGLARTARTGGGHRRYTTTDIADLRLMRDEISRGRRTAQAAVLVRDAATSVEPYASFVHAFLDVAATRQARRLDVLLDYCRERFGLDEAICRVVLPGMRLIGVAWQTGRCDISQEHLLTQATRDWLQKVRSQGPVPWQPDPIVLSCGPADLHTIGLEAMEVLLAHRGWECHLFGKGISPSDLTAAINRTRAAATIVVSHIASHRRATVAALQAAAGTSTQLFYAGNAFLMPSTRKSVPGTYLGENLTEAVETVSGSLQAAKGS
ncbi:MAG: MerR family transcriptional regulator [Geodermatophilaceae bacterium]|nr:MerR family transcriptional regulator [Geodermatophilaceae bacterium]